MNDFHVFALMGAIVVTVFILVVLVIQSFTFLLKLAAVILFIGLVVLGIYGIFVGIGYIVHLLINLFSRKGK